jgi:hypothetical protein
MLSKVKLDFLFSEIHDRLKKALRSLIGHVRSGPVKS